MRTIKVRVMRNERVLSLKIAFRLNLFSPKTEEIQNTFIQKTQKNAKHDYNHLLINEELLLFRDCTNPH